MVWTVGNGQLADMCAAQQVSPYFSASRMVACQLATGSAIALLPDSMGLPKSHGNISDQTTSDSRPGRYSYPGTSHHIAEGRGFGHHSSSDWRSCLPLQYSSLYG